MNSNIRLILSCLLLGMGLYCLVWSYRPLRFTTQLIPLDIARLPNGNSNIEVEENTWEVGIELPMQVRLGETILIELWLKEAKLTGSGRVAGWETLFATYQPITQARLELSGGELAPQGQISQPVEIGTTQHVYWQVQPVLTGMVRGTLWLHMNYLPRLPGVEEHRRLLLAYPINLPVRSLFGLGVLPIQVIGIVLSILGVGFLIISGRTRNSKHKRQEVSGR